jgi:phenylpyruvate tautomerase PptA (4-oxalocrotonate tautomerase family)
MKRECHVRFCEGGGVKIPSATRLYYPASATARYTIIEISMFEGRSIETKKHLIRLLFERVCTQADRLPNEVEVTISETPKHNWGFRGLPGDEVGLGYKVEV